MIYGRWEDIKLEDMTFESCYYYSRSGSMIVAVKEIRPIIHLSGERAFADIVVGYQNYTMGDTMGDEPNEFKTGESVADWLARHGVSADAVEKIVVYSVDTTEEKEVHETFSGTPNCGWVREDCIEF
jgi:hypothetical protein